MFKSIFRPIYGGPKSVYELEKSEKMKYSQKIHLKFRPSSARFDFFRPDCFTIRKYIKNATWQHVTTYDYLL